MPDNDAALRVLNKREAEYRKQLEYLDRIVGVDVAGVLASWPKDDLCKFTQTVVFGLRLACERGLSLCENNRKLLQSNEELLLSVKEMQQPNRELLAGAMPKTPKRANLRLVKDDEPPEPRSE